MTAQILGIEGEKIEVDSKETIKFRTCVLFNFTLVEVLVGNSFKIVCLDSVVVYFLVTL